MLYYLLDWLDKTYDIPGFGVFKYISFRAVLSIIFSLIISMLIGKKIIDVLSKRLIGESIRTDGPASHQAKKGTPTMGGLIIMAAIVVPTLLWADLKNGYVWLILIATLWMCAIGFIDDYIKVFKKDKQGLKGRFKIVGQVLLGILVGCVMLWHPDFMGSRKHITQLNVIKTSDLLAQNGFVNGDKLIGINGQDFSVFPDGDAYDSLAVYKVERKKDDALPAAIKLISIDKGKRKQVAQEMFGAKDKSFIYQTDFPFFKNYVFDYSRVIFFKHYVSEEILGRIIFLLVAIFMITAVSNGVNITDGIDGLAAGTSAIAVATLGIFAYLSGNNVFAGYLHLSYIPLSAELLVFAAAMVGACIGFLWYNTYPAQVFMGDTGSLMLGGAIGVLGLMVKKELLLPMICGIFLIESLSVIIQVSYFKYTRKRYGEGRRIFRMSPLHHHYELKGLHESKIVTRFWIVAILLALLAFATVKLR